MKVWEKILDRRLKTIVNVSSNHFGFSAGRSTTDAIFILLQMQQKYVKNKQKLYHVFVDLEKAFDRIPRRTLRWALRKQMVPEKLVRLVLALYDDSKSCVAAAGGISDAFSVSVRVHQGSGLSLGHVIRGLSDNYRGVEEGCGARVPPMESSTGEKRSQVQC